MAIPVCLFDFLRDHLDPAARELLKRLDLDFLNGQIARLEGEITKYTSYAQVLQNAVDFARIRVEQVESLRDKAAAYVALVPCVKVDEIRERFDEKLTEARAALSFAQSQLDAVQSLNSRISAEKQNLEQLGQSTAWQEYDSALNQLVSNGG